MTMLPTISAVLLFSCVSATAVETAVETAEAAAEAAAEAIFDVSMTGAFAVSDRLGYIVLPCAAGEVSSLRGFCGSVGAV